ncbi:MAG: glycosyltransferase family 4 protein [Zoogloeaceae bacterium]|jgi:glycosyltransferase involved in cell wall biosynthesis|nr:glycosyltransferase family 4 protein [Zoogloeaceae bacterium]
MRIVIDMQGAQAESRFRGIGRYTLGFAQGVARNRGKHEVLLALNGLFPETIEPIRAAFQEVLPQENIRVWSAPGPVANEFPVNDARREAAELIREAFLASLKPDIIHICSLFEGYIDDAVSSIRRFDQISKVSVSLYDLIPFLNPDHYLKPNPTYAQHYGRKIQFLKKAALYLAISEFSRQEGLQCLGMDENRIINASTAIGTEFHPISIRDADATKLRQKFGLTRPFVLYTGGSDERKNLPALIQAYAALPEELRREHQLVFAGRIPEINIEALGRVSESQGIRPDELCLTGYVTDEELINLYNLCQLFVFPSLHEGFGLPALEAMACGAPIIAANTSSLPEVVALEAALFDPHDVTSMTEKMARALRDADFRASLREHGLRQARLFSWNTTAERAIRAWAQLVNS